MYDCYTDAFSKLYKFKEKYEVLAIHEYVVSQIRYFTMFDCMYIICSLYAYHKCSILLATSRQNYMCDFQPYYIVPEGTLNDRLYEKPSEKDLLKVAKKVGGNWRYLLIGLDIQHGTIEQLWQKSLANPQQACFYGLVEWRSGGTQGHNQATWSTLLSALKNEAENGELARELEQELLCTQRGMYIV